MQEKTIIIIEADIAGLAAGCYGQMNGCWWPIAIQTASKRT
jgi:hypothetical protein